MKSKNLIDKEAVRKLCTKFMYLTSLDISSLWKKMATSEPALFEVMNNAIGMNSKLITSALFDSSLFERPEDMDEDPDRDQMVGKLIENSLRISEFHQKVQSITRAAFLMGLYAGELKFESTLGQELLLEEIVPHNPNKEGDRFKQFEEEMRTRVEKIIKNLDKMDTETNSTNDFIDRFFSDIPEDQEDNESEEY